MDHEANQSGMPASDPGPDEPILAQLADKPRRRMLPLVLVVTLLLIFGLFVGPAIYFALPGELVRWRIASAEEKRLDGDIQGAIADLDKALQHDPQELQLLEKRAEWNVELKNYPAALNDCDQIVKLRPDDPGGYMWRSQVFQYLGEHEKAVEDWKRIMDLDIAQTTEGRGFALNGLAYARALANIEIDEGLKDIDDAMRRVGERYEMLDTRGYLLYRAGDYQRALDDLNRAVENAREDFNESKPTKDGFGWPDRREQDLESRQLARHFAVILYHRGLIHQAGGDQHAAQADFDRVKELGFEPNDQLF
jgi:tetratricopeptide (TPR) repeat protein